MAEAPSRLDYGQLIKDLKDVVDWFQLGIHLGIERSRLQEIGDNFRGDTRRCKAEMLGFWIDSDENASMEKLIRALEEIDHRNLASQLRDYGVLQRGHQSEQSTPVTVDELLDPPSENEKRLLDRKCMINQLDHEVMVEYAKFTLELLKLFKDKGVSVNDAIYTFVDLVAESSLTSDMRAATDIQGFLTALKRTQSWYNFELIASMAAVLGGDEGERLVSSYESKLKVHFTKRQTVYGGQAEVIVIKVDESKENFTKEKVVAFKNTIIRVLSIEQRCLVLKSLKKGCVELTYLFPQALATELKSCVMACTDDLKNLLVISVRIGSETVWSENQPSGYSGKEDALSKPSERHTKEQERTLAKSGEEKAKEATDDVENVLETKAEIALLEQQMMQEKVHIAARSDPDSSETASSYLYPTMVGRETPTYMYVESELRKWEIKAKKLETDMNDVEDNVRKEEEWIRTAEQREKEKIEWKNGEIATKRTNIIQSLQRANVEEDPFVREFLRSNGISSVISQEIEVMLCTALADIDIDRSRELGEHFAQIKKHLHQLESLQTKIKDSKRLIMDHVHEYRYIIQRPNKELLVPVEILEKFQKKIDSLIQTGDMCDIIGERCYNVFEKTQGLQEDWKSDTNEFNQLFEVSINEMSVRLSKLKKVASEATVSGMVGGIVGSTAGGIIGSIIAGTQAIPGPYTLLGLIVGGFVGILLGDVEQNQVVHSNYGKTLERAKKEHQKLKELCA